jgi:hypothetical protein
MAPSNNKNFNPSFLDAENPGSYLDIVQKTQITAVSLWLYDYTNDIVMMNEFCNCWHHAYLSFHYAWRPIRICAAPNFGSSSDGDNCNALHYPSRSGKRNLLQARKILKLTS